MAFRDYKPVATNHWQVIPKQHIRDVGALSANHLPVLQQMAGIADGLLSSVGADRENARVGFHVSCRYSVGHLHCHVIYPWSDVSERKKKKYTGRVFETMESVLQRLQ